MVNDEKFDNDELDKWEDYTEQPDETGVPIDAFVKQRDTMAMVADEKKTWQPPWWRRLLRMP